MFVCYKAIQKGPIIPDRGLAVGMPDGKRRLAIINDRKAGIEQRSSTRK